MKIGQWKREIVYLIKIFTPFQTHGSLKEGQRECEREGARESECVCVWVSEERNKEIASASNNNPKINNICYIFVQSFGSGQDKYFFMNLFKTGLAEPLQ